MTRTGYAVLAVVGLVAACSKAPPKEIPVLAAPTAVTIAAPVPLKPVLAAAIACVTDCKTLYDSKADEPAPFDLALPRKFGDLLSNSTIRAKYEIAVKSLPPELQEPLTKRAGTTATGSLSSVVTRGGGQVYLYGLVRFDPPGKQRSYADIAVDPLTKEVAILMRPTSDLDQYYLTGPDQLRAALLLEAAAGDIRSAKQELRRVQTPSDPTDWNADSFVLPFDSSRAAQVSTRLTYLNTKYEGDRLANVASPAEWIEAKKIQQEATWYAADLNFSKCISTMSPAERISLIQDAGVRAVTKDRTDASGRLLEVEVSYDEGSRERYFRYFKSIAECDASLARNESVPDRYR